LLAGFGKTRLHVVGVRCALKILHVAGIAVRRRPYEIPVHVALIAGDINVSARQGKTRKRVVIKGDGSPVCGTVAGSAILGEPRLQMIGVSGRGEVFQMATGAIRGGHFVVAIDVTVRASQRGVHAGKGETGKCRVIKLGAYPSIHAMAGLASRG
jgi:hypothetical protein